MRTSRKFLVGLLAVVTLSASLAIAIPAVSNASDQGLDPATLGMRPNGSFLDASRLAQVEGELGQPINWYVGMAGRNSISDMRGSVWGQLRNNQAVLPTVSDRLNLVMTVPLTFGRASARTDSGRADIRSRLLETAAGAHNNDFRVVAENLVAGGYPDAVIRLGHEFTGHWYPWSAQGNADAYIAAYREVHDVMSAVSPDFQFEWNAARNTFVEFGPPAYPGDAYVDVVGLDVYYEPWKGDGELTQDLWERRYLSILETHQQFAAERGKPVSYAEWANGGVDEPRFIRYMYDWFSSLPSEGDGALLYHSYFNATNALYDLDNFPNSKAEYNRLFGRDGAATEQSSQDVSRQVGSATETTVPAAAPAVPANRTSNGGTAATVEAPAQLTASLRTPITIDIDSDADSFIWWRRNGGGLKWTDRAAEDVEVEFLREGTYDLVVSARKDGAVTRANIKVTVEGDPTVPAAAPAAVAVTVDNTPEPSPAITQPPTPTPSQAPTTTQAPVTTQAPNSTVAPVAERAQEPDVEHATHDDDADAGHATHDDANTAQATHDDEAEHTATSSHDDGHATHSHGSTGQWVRASAENAVYRDSTVPETHHLFDPLGRNAPDGWGPSRIGFVVHCDQVGFDQIDPIVSPGGQSGHLHEFFGNPNVTPNSTTQSLADTPLRQIECTDQNDKSAYWTPAVFQNGRRIAASHITAYYKSPSPNTVPMPFGLRMIAGDASATSNQPSRVGWWQTGGSNTTAGRNQMLSGSTVTLRMNFPNCWDGIHLDSPDHQSHVAYAQNGRCPSSHPVAIPQLTTFTDYNTSGGNGFDLSSGEWYTFHQDFWNAWSPEQMEELHRECNLAELNCRANRSPALLPLGQYEQVFGG